jgi:integrase
LTGRRIILHGIRHGYPTAAKAAGEPSKVVSKRLGHASTSITTNPYRHVPPSMGERRAMRRRREVYRRAPRPRHRSALVVATSRMVLAPAGLPADWAG